MTSPFEQKCPFRAQSGINGVRDVIFGNHEAVNWSNISNLAIPMEFRILEIGINIHCGLIMHCRYVNLSEMMINSKNIHESVEASDKHFPHAPLAIVLHSRRGQFVCRLDYQNELKYLT